MANSILASLKVLISANTAQLDKNLKQSENSLARFTKTITSAGNLIGVAFSSVAIFNGLKAGVGIMMDFEHTMSEVKAITEAVGDEFKKLETDAKKLGASTKFTASQVGQLQVAYGRLGFTTREILAATSATLDLAAATGEDLAKSADVAGSTVRGFGLNASETGRVVDVMAASFNKTALGLENFTESMKYVAPVANAAGATVEETTAMLGVLADAGIRGSMAGTSLRKIFTDMTRDGRPLKERLAELGKKGITLADSFDEVGRTAQTSLLILSKNTEKTDELTNAFQRAKGEASAMARVMQDDLVGDVTLLTSAWEGFLIKIGNTQPIRNATQSITQFINILSGGDDFTKRLNDVAKTISDFGKPTQAQIENLKELRRELGKPIDIKVIQELIEKYKLSESEASVLTLAIGDVNKAISEQEYVLGKLKIFSDAIGYKDASEASKEYKEHLYNQLVAQQSALATLQKTTPEFKKDIKVQEEKIAATRRAIVILEEYEKSIAKTAATVLAEQAEQADTLKILKERLEDLNKAYENTAITDNARKTRIADEIRQLKLKIVSLERIKKLSSGEATLFDPGSLNTSFGEGAKPAGSFLKDMGMDFQYVDGKIKQAGASMKAFGLIVKQVQKDVIDMGPMISNSIGQFAAAMGRASVDSRNFGEDIMRSITSFMEAFGSALIAAGVGKVAFDSFSGPAMIAAGALLVAGAAAAQAAIDNRPDLSTTSRGAAARSADTFTQRQVEILLGGEFTIYGPDLKLVYDRQSQLNGRTG